jgi:hypothetical protein
MTGYADGESVGSRQLFAREPLLDDASPALLEAEILRWRKEWSDDCARFGEFIGVPGAKARPGNAMTPRARIKRP